MGVFYVYFDPVHQLDSLFVGLDLLGGKFRFARDEADVAGVRFVWIGIGTDRDRHTKLDAAELGLGNIAAEPGLVDLAQSE